MLENTTIILLKKRTLKLHCEVIHESMTYYTGIFFLNLSILRI